MMKVHDLTDRQIDMLTFIHGYQTEYGFAPATREIGEAVGIRSTSVVNYQINRLVQLGYIRKVREVSRSITLLPPAYEAIGGQVPDDCDFSMLRAELLALRAENRRIRELYCQKPGTGMQSYLADTGLKCRIMQ